MPLPALPDDLPPFELLNTGKDRRASNVLRGSVGGADVVVFDYHYFDAQRTVFLGLHYYRDLAGATVACVRESRLTLPAFTMEPSFGEAMRQAEAQVEQQLGSGRMATTARTLISFAEGIADTQPGWGFGDRTDVPYRLRGDDAAVRAVFRPVVLEYFREHPHWIVEGRGSWLLVTFPLKTRDYGFTSQKTAGNDGTLSADQLTSLVRAATDTLEVFRSEAR
jgi:hypothetical protein